MTRLLATLAALTVGGTGILGAPVSAASKDPIVYQTVAPSQENSFFDITTPHSPQVGQSITVQRASTWKSIEMGVYQVKLVKSKDVFAWMVAGKYDEKWFTSHMDNYRVKARATVEVWRYDGEGDIPRTLDLSLGFTQVHKSTMSRTLPVGSRVTFPLKGGVSVTPGRYFVVVGLRFDDWRVFNLRFTGQESGNNTMGGYNHDHPVRPECAKYKMTKDAHPGGIAYRQQSNVRPGPPDWLQPFATTFEVVLTKAAMPCDMNGVYDPNEQIWNYGDLGMVIRGSRL